MNRRIVRFRSSLLTSLRTPRTRPRWRTSSEPDRGSRDVADCFQSDSNRFRRPFLETPYSITLMVQLERLDFTILGIEVRRRSGLGWLIRALLFGAARASDPRYIKFMQALMRDETDEK